MKQMILASVIAASLAALYSSESAYAEGIAGVTHWFYVSEPDDIVIADSGHNTNFGVTSEYIAAEFNSDTCLSVREQHHLSGESYFVSLRLNRLGALRHKAVGSAKLYGLGPWCSTCADVKFTNDGGVININNCDMGDTIYSAKLTLYLANINVASRRTGHTVQYIMNAVGMHEFIHGVGFLGHPVGFWNECKVRVIASCQVFPDELTGDDIGLVEGVYCPG